MFAGRCWDETARTGDKSPNNGIAQVAGRDAEISAATHGPNWRAVGAARRSLFQKRRVAGAFRARAAPGRRGPILQSEPAQVPPCWTSGVRGALRCGPGLFSGEQGLMPGCLTSDEDYWEQRAGLLDEGRACRQLWSAVLAENLRCALGVGTRPISDADVFQAQGWIGTDAFVRVCVLAGFEPNRVMAYFERERQSDRPMEAFLSAHKCYVGGAHVGKG